MRFFFDVCEGGKLARDDDGFECSDVRAAVSEAVKAAMAIGVDTLPRFDDGGEVSIEVRDSHGHRVASAAVSLKVTRA